MSTMTNKLQDAKERLERLAADSVFDASPEIREQLLGLVTALDYHDIVLLEHQMSALQETMRQQIHHKTLDLLARVRTVHSAISQSWQTLQGRASEAGFDPLGKVLDETLGWILGVMADFLASVLASPECGEAEFAVKFQQELARMQELRTSIHVNWPWTSRPRPPLDRGMIARARASRAKREKHETLDELITRCGVADPE